MKTMHILCGSTLFLLCAVLPLEGQSIPLKGRDTITPEEMKAHMAYLASDEMKGRNTPSPELDSCASYIARQFASYGLKPACKGSYYQIFNTLKTNLSSPNTFALITASGRSGYQLKDDFVPLAETANRKIENIPVVFAGYGITATEYRYDDYSDINTRGKVVFVFTGEPQEKDTSSVFNGSETTDHSKTVIKIENAIQHGAVGMILVQAPSRRFNRPPNSWPSLMRLAPKDAVPLTFEEKAENKIVCVQIGRDLALALLADTGNTLEDLYSRIDQNLTPVSFDITGRTVTIETQLDAERTPTTNVAGLLEGSDPLLKNEILVIGAHYDHVGETNGVIYNGADDNASGTSGVMEVAEAFASSPVKPRRSVLFITFAGEERGLFGSRYYTGNPLFPVENTVAMLDMDMISRNDSNEVAIVAAGSSPDLKAVNEKANEGVGLKLLYDSDAFFYQSDHYPFYKKGIPVLFYFAKDHPDLHKPTDDIDKIIPEKMARIGKLVFSTAWIVANQEGRPDYVKTR